MVPSLPRQVDKIGDGSPARCVPDATARRDDAAGRIRSGSSLGNAEEGVKFADGWPELAVFGGKDGSI